MQRSLIMHALLLALFACTPLCGCGKNVQDARDAAQTVAPQDDALEQPTPDADQTTNPEIPVDAPELAPVEIVPARLDPAVHARFVRGISLADARALTPIQPVRVGGDGKATEIYRWTDENGNYLTVRFDAGILVTKSNLGTQHAARDTTTPRTAEDVANVDTASAAQIAPGVFIPLERAIASSTDQPMGAREAPLPPPPASQPIRWRAPEPRSAPDGPRVAVAGATRRARDQADHPDAPEASSYNPRAKLPEFARSLREGSFEIRFVNPGNAPISAGLRQDNLGSDAVAPPKGQASIKVDRGTYNVFFIRDDEPFTLYEANPIVIDGFQATDVEVHLNQDDVEVRLIDYGRPDEN